MGSFTTNTLTGPGRVKAFPILPGYLKSKYMQALGYIIDEKSEEKILILVRQGSYGRHLKRRRRGKDGIHFSDEQVFLNEPEMRERMDRLKNFEPIFC